MKKAVFVLVVLAVLVPTEAWGCAVCYGDPDSAQTQGLNRAIWALLAIVGAVQVGFVTMFVRFRRRARRSTEGATIDENPRRSLQ